MTSPWQRIQAIAKELTARERAILRISAICAGEDGKNSWQFEIGMPDEQRPEYDRLVRLASQANDQAHSWMPLWQRWILEMDTDLAWSSLSGHGSRAARYSRSAWPRPQ